MKKILFTLEIALFLLVLPLVLGMALGRKMPADNDSRQYAIPAVKNGLQPNTYSVAVPAAVNKAI